MYFTGGALSEASVTDGTLIGSLPCVDSAVGGGGLECVLCEI